MQFALNPGFTGEDHQPEAAMPISQRGGPSGFAGDQEIRLLLPAPFWFASDPS